MIFAPKVRTVLEALMAVAVTLLLEIGGAFVALGILIGGEVLPRLTVLEASAAVLLLAAVLTVSGVGCFRSAMKRRKTLGLALILLASMVIGVVGGFSLEFIARHPPGSDYMGEALSTPGAMATLVAGIMLRRWPDLKFWRSGSMLAVIGAFLLTELMSVSVVRYFVKLEDLSGVPHAIATFIVPLAVAGCMVVLMHRARQEPARG
jgi:hypothetical protein